MFIGLFLIYYLRFITLVGYRVFDFGLTAFGKDYLLQHTAVAEVHFFQFGTTAQINRIFVCIAGMEKFQVGEVLQIVIRLDVAHETLKVHQAQSCGSLCLFFCTALLPMHRNAGSNSWV